MTINYGDGQVKPAGTWDYMRAQTQASSGDYAVRIFQWVAKSKSLTAGGAAFRCRGYVGDDTAIQTAEIFVRALNDGYPSEKVFKGKKSGSFLRSNDLPRYLPVEYVEWQIAAGL